MTMPSSAEKIKLALRELLRRHRCPLQRASRALGRYPAYLSRTSGGRVPLKVEDVFRVLALLKVDPYAFFRRSFPLGGEGQEHAAPSGSRAFEHDGRDRLAEMLRSEEALRGATPPTPREWTQRAGKLLRAHLHAARISQQEASRLLGWGPKVLGHGLQGATRLTFEHLFGTLQVARVSPGRFFEELFGPGEDDLVPGLSWSGLIELLEPLTVAAFEPAGQRGAGLRTTGAEEPDREQLGPGATDLQRDLDKLRGA
jgi:hypothetical protein